MYYNVDRTILFIIQGEFMKNLDSSVNPEELLKKVKNLRERVFNNGNELFKKWEAKINKRTFYQVPKI